MMPAWTYGLPGVLALAWLVFGWHRVGDNEGAMGRAHARIDKMNEHLRSEVLSAERYAEALDKTQTKQLRELADLLGVEWYEEKAKAGWRKKKKGGRR